MKTVIIIGGGASGLATASTLSKNNKYRIIILDQANKLARKVLASGNGRCNISNLDLDIKNYNTSNSNIEKIINDFNIKEFFLQRGMIIRCLDNLVYPYSLSSLTVKNTLIDSLNNVEIHQECKLIYIKKDNGYTIITNQGNFNCDYVIIATGSKASKLSSPDNLDALEPVAIIT